MLGGVHNEICANTVKLKLAVPTLVLLKFNRGATNVIKTNLLFNINCNVFSTGGVPVLYRFISAGCETATCNVVGVANMFTKTTIADLLKH